MYVGYSWPKFLQCPGLQGHYVAVFQDHTHLVAVSEHSIAAWSSGHARVRLGQHTLSEQELEQYGRHVCACWSSNRGAVAVLTEAGYLLLYDLHVTKQLVLPYLRSQTWGVQDSSQCLHAVDVYVKHAVRCGRAVPATCMCCDSRIILVAYADGFWGSCGWSGKMHPELFDIMPEGCDEEDDPDQRQQQQQLPLHQQQLPRHAAVNIHYCEVSRLLSVVFADGSAALYSPAGAGHLQAQLTFRRWLCTAAARATAARIAAQAQLVALGTAAGEVHLLRQHCPAAAGAQAAGDMGMSPLAAAAAAAGAFSPLGGCGQTPFDFSRAGLDPQQLMRTLDLADWGHTAKQTGAVAALAWAPDDRALAVGFSKQGLVLWTPSGCRLLCTLRQPPPETPASGRASTVSPFMPTGSSGISRPGSAGDTETAGLNGVAGSSSAGNSSSTARAAVVSVDGSVTCLAWGVDGYQLMLAGTSPNSSSPDSHAAAASSSSGASIMYELSLAKSLRHHHRVTQAAAADGGAAGGVAQLGEELHVLQASDRLLLITEPLTSNGLSSFLAAGMGGLDPSEAASGSSSDLHVHHVLLPAAYLAANWPLQHVAVSPCGSDIAAAGARGLVVYNRKQERWRMFGEVMQERRVSCVALAWLSGCVVVASCSSTGPEPAAFSPAATAAAAAAVASAATSGLDLTRGAGAGFKCQLLLFPRNHLDFSSVVASKTLHKVPLAMDCTDSHILLASAPLELLVLQLEGAASPASAGGSAPEGGLAASGRLSSASGAAGKAKLVAVRELSLFNVGRPVQDVALVSLAAADLAHKALTGQMKGSNANASEPSSTGSSGKAAPRHAVLLRWGGMLSVLDLSRGAEIMLAEEVESFWLSDTLSVPTVAASSKAGSTCVSAAHSRTSSIQGLPGAVTSAGQEALLGPEAAAAGAEDGSSSTVGGAALVLGGNSISGSSSVDPLAANMDSALEVPEVVEMPWWAYGPVGMQLWFPSIVLAAMQLQTLHGSSSNSALHSQASLPAQLTPHAAAAAGLGPGPFVGGLGSRTSSGVPGSLVRSGSLWPPIGASLQGLQPSGGSLAAAAAAGAAAAAAGGQPGSARAAALHMKHAQSAPSLSQDGGASAGGFQAIQYGTEIELEFDREVYPIGVSLADASIVGVTQRVMRSQQAAAAQSSSPRAARSSLPSRHHPMASQGALLTAGAATGSGSNSLSLPCLLPVPESQPVLPALLRRLLQQGALLEALALAKRHEGGPHFKRSLEWLLFTTLDMEGSKCKPGKAGATVGGLGSNASWQQQQPLHVLQGGAGAAGSGVLGRQGKGWLGHVDGQPHPVPVTPLLAAAVDLVLSFEQCLDVVVSVSRKTDASLWPAMFSAVGSPSAVLELLLDTGSLTSAACFLIVVDRLEGSHAAQAFAVQLIKLALKRGQFYLCAEILRFLIPPREGVMQWGPSSHDGAAAAAATTKGAAEAAAMPAAPQRQPSVSAAPSNADSGSQSRWLSWIWGSGGSKQLAGSQQQQQVPAAKAGKQSAAVSVNGSQDVIAAGYPVEGLVSQSSLTAAAGVQHGSDACSIVANKAWRLLEQGKLRQLVQLIHSMSFLTGGLASIMAAFTPQPATSSLDHAGSGTADVAAGVLLFSKQQQQVPGGAAAQSAVVLPDASEVTVDVLIGCVLAAVEELPVWEGNDVEQDAALVLELAKELQVQRWTLAMSVLLVDMSELAPFAAVQPELWQQFCGQLLEQPELYFLHQLVGALVTPSSPVEELNMGAADEEQQEQQGLLQE